MIRDHNYLSTVPTQSEYESVIESASDRGNPDRQSSPIWIPTPPPAKDKTWTMCFLLSMF